ncbi:MAG TPA: hypothetical protein DDX91_09225 [Ruminococcaceae bacterium]|nr:hypothetical protein [Oscillospiraceae bacterium]
MWKKTISCLLSLTLGILLSISVSANEPNILSDYTNLDWRGDTLYLDKGSGAIYFQRNDDGSAQKATLSIDVEQGSTGFLFYVDVGNGNKKGDGGFCSIQFYDGNNKELLGRSTGTAENLEHYVRYYIGEDERFYPIPDGAKKLTVTLSAWGEGRSANVNVYYRNFSLFFSDNIPLSDSAADEVYMKSSSSLSKVEVGLTPYTRWIWIGIVFLVALSFYLIRVWRQKYSTPKINSK